jgi:hypothetical protein
MGECIDLGVEREFRHVMLGLGDVIIPGYFVAFCFWLDVAKAAPRRTVRWLYRSIALIGIFFYFFLLKTNKNVPTIFFSIKNAPLFF